MAETTAEFETRLARVESELDGLKSMLARQQVLAPIEIYTDQRVAEFLLSSAVDAESYQRACDEVVRMGLDPAQIVHWTPAGGWPPEG